MNIVLLEPEIPSNTGNIARTCVCTGSRLHLIRPLGFSLSEKNLMRAGMDYWHLLDLTVYDDLADFLSQKGQGRLFLATTKGKQTYTDVIYGYDDYIMFGKESAGIPEEILASNEEHTKTISNTCVNSSPVSDCSKTGNGYAKITFIG